MDKQRVRKRFAENRWTGASSIRKLHYASGHTYTGIENGHRVSGCIDPFRNLIT